MESITYLKDIKITPKKLRMYLDVIKKLSPQQALDYLMYAPQKQGKIYYKAIHSAISNATNTLKVSPDVLQFKLFVIEEGRAIKRYLPGSRGTVKPIKRRFSHIKIVLVENKKSKAKVLKSSEKKESKVEKKVVSKTAIKAKSVKTKKSE